MSHKFMSLSSKVKLPIIEHIFIIEHFSIFSSFLNHILQLAHYKCSLIFRSKEAMQKKQRWVIVCFNIFENRALDFFGSKVRFEWFKTW
jgi:hypothetical protein